MPLDAYSLCPGGTGKKIKFCCHDSLGDLEKMSQMLEGNQHLACLNHIDQLLKKRPDRACLLATRGLVFRMLGRLEEAVDNAALFLEKHPENSSALAEAAIVTAVEKGGMAAISLLHRALDVCQGQVSARVYDAIGSVGEMLLSDGQWLAGRGVLNMLLSSSNENRNAVEMLMEFNRSDRIPLLLKNEPIMQPCPDDAPWKDRFEEAMAPIGKAMWISANEKLTALTEEVGDSPAIWRNLAILRGWLGDKPGCIEALRKIATLDVSADDAVEAEALAMLADDDPLGDAFDVVQLTWNVADVDEIQAALTLDARALKIPFDLSSLGDEDNPPPKSGFLLHGLPILETSENEQPSLDDLSPMLGQAMLYARQTDRDARLELLGVAADDVPRLIEVLGEAIGETLPTEHEQQVMSRTPASRELFQMKCRPPKDVTREQIETISELYLDDAILNRWPDMKLGVFDGKSAREVVGDESLQTRLSAVVLVLELWSEGLPGEVDFNELRAKLDLPIPGPVDPQQTPLETLSLARLSRVELDTVSDESLLAGYRRVVGYGVKGALPRFARAVVDRPSLAATDERLNAFMMLARTETDPQQALKCIEEGRAAAESAGRSSALWDLEELSYHFARQQGPEAARMIEHIQTQHISEPGVAERFTNMLVEAGLLNPDGTPAAMPGMQGGPGMQADPMAGSPDQSEPEQSKLWTPDGGDSGGEGKKLWTPD